jgi:L-ascorbate metabolism protein UlaG (beta-lactamase superfamily)
MRRLFAFVLLPLVAVPLVAIPLAAQEKAKQPTVSWYGQSFFTIKSGKGTIVAFDPHMIPAFGRPEGLRADIVCMSHLHNDHTNIFAFENPKDPKMRLLNGVNGVGNRTNWNNVDETIQDIRIRNIPTFHDDAEGMVRGKNSIFLVEIDGWKFCHLGDLGHELTEAQLKKIGEVDVLMIPVGGVYTLNGSQAKKVVEQIKPKEYIFPMHYGLPFFEDLLPIDEFLEEQDRKNIAVSQENQVALNRDKQRPRPLIVQLSSTPKKK